MLHYILCSYILRESNGRSFVLDHAGYDVPSQQWDANFQRCYLLDGIHVGLGNFGDQEAIHVLWKRRIRRSAQDKNYFCRTISLLMDSLHRAFSFEKLRSPLNSSKVQ